MGYVRAKGSLAARFEEKYHEDAPEIGGWLSPFFFWFLKRF